MNIFVLDECPFRAAFDQCDKHVVKMVLETAQLLCSAYPEDTAPYKRTHYNHPSAVWTRESLENYRWLLDHGLALALEYQLRYNKTHKSLEAIKWCASNVSDIDFPQFERTPFKLAMPDEYKCDDAVTAYRNYYKHEKASIAKWDKALNVPTWWEKL